METGILKFCREKGIGFIAFSPLAQGLLTDRYVDGISPDSRMARAGSLTKDRLTEIFSRAGCSRLHFDGVEGHLFMVAAVGE